MTTQANHSSEINLPAHVREVFANASCIYTRQEVEQSLDKMATDISYALSHTNPVLLCVVLGGIVPLGNLLPRLDFPLEIDYVHVGRYGHGSTGGGLNWLVEPKISLKDRTVLIVDDILDGGITLAELTEFCKKEGARMVQSAVLVDKKAPRDPSGLEKADFSALTTEDRFLFGFGMDYKGYLRNAPGIYMVAPEHQ